jgi:hypothetical protein
LRLERRRRSVIDILFLAIRRYKGAKTIIT